MPADAELLNAGASKTGNAERIEKSLGQSANVPEAVMIGNVGVERPVAYHIYMYTTSKTEYTLVRPPYAKGLKAPGVGTPSKKVNMWTGDDKCRLFAVLPDVVVNFYQDVFTNAMIKNEEDGRRIAMDILCPANHGIDQDLVLDPGISTLNGKNYLNAGLFFSLNNPPKPEEVSKAVARMETYYRYLLQRARTEEIRGPKALEAFLSEYPEAYAAANHFGQKVSWNTVVESPEICELTGETYRKGAAWHTSPDGFVCVHDWQKAVAAGRKTKTDVPEDKRWWKEEAPKPTK
jgi:hypothetical protein